MEIIILVMAMLLLIGFGITTALLIKSNQQNIRELTGSFALQLQSLDKERNIVSKTEGMRILLPLKIQASERLVLFLERMQASVMVNRYIVVAENAESLAQLMLSGIREEFEHNLSQQLFVSDFAWQLTKAAREEMVQAIHLGLAGLPEKAPAVDLAKLLLTSEIRIIQNAINQLREDLEKFA